MWQESRVKEDKDGWCDKKSWLSTQLDNDDGSTIDRVLLLLVIMVKKNRILSEYCKESTIIFSTFFTNNRVQNTIDRVLLLVIMLKKNRILLEYCKESTIIFSTFLQITEYYQSTIDRVLLCFNAAKKNWWLWVIIMLKKKEYSTIICYNAEKNNRVMLGKFDFHGALSFCFNIQILSKM